MSDPAASPPTVSARDLVAGLEAIIDAAAGVLAERSLDATLRAMADALAGIVPFTSLAVYDVDHAAGELQPVFAVGSYLEQTLANRIPIEGSLSGVAVREARMVHVERDDEADNFTIPGTPSDEQEAVVFVPLLVGREVTGTLNVWREGEDPSFTPAEAQLISRFARLAGLAYANARQRDQLREQALTDELTGLANRRHFHARLVAELGRAAAAQQVMSLVTFDLDDFKAINDSYGHPAGDRALRAFAACLSGEARATDLVCRVGGEEFAAVLVGAGRPAAEAFARRALAATRRLELGGGLRLTASAGVACTPGDGDTIEALLHVADDRLLAAKALGKDRVVTDA